MNGTMKMEVNLPRKVMLAVMDLAHQLGTTEEGLVLEAVLAHLPALEARRKILEAHEFPKAPYPEKGS